MAGSITGANATIYITIPNLYDTPQKLQGFAADDVFDGDPIESVETLMGVDGFMSAGFVFVEVTQNYALQADSDSVAIFDNWWASQQAAQEAYFANGQVLLSNLGKKWVMTRGVLKGYKPIPDIKKLLQPQRFRITWNRIQPQPS